MNSETAVVVNGIFTLLNLGLVGLSLKLYTEFIKEKKYREP